MERLGPGSVIDGFTLQSKFAKGGMGSLWNATKEGIDYPVVLKMPFLDPGQDVSTIVGFVTIGALLSDIYSPAFAAVCSPLDIIFGTLASFLASVAISLCRQLFIATLFPAIFNGLLLGFEFGYISVYPDGSWPLFWVNFGWVCLGEVIAVCVLGYLIFMILSKKTPRFYKVVLATQNQHFRW
jgi:hypothetical protein